MTNEITAINIYILSKMADAHMLYSAVRPSEHNGLDDDQLIREAHVRAAYGLELYFSGGWVYRYGELREGVTMDSPGVYLSYRKHDNSAYIDGVTDMSLIKDGGFTGQFQQKKFTAGLVPAYVSIINPAAEERRLNEESIARKLLLERKKALIEKIGSLPPIDIAEGEQGRYQDWVKINSDDGYSHAVVKFANAWAVLMQPLIAEAIINDTFGELADLTSHEANVEGITGFQYGVAVQVLSQFWRHGEVLRLWHNAQYGHSGDGVVNPAVLVGKSLMEEGEA